ncbi:GNAT family N-acetyltransferase [Micromonospora sp. NPDC049366]|uniref:GNAT family N-acetyltransferase n=1 Tax=Micromonospora sp. NPDC049366 TaxID=3364271 RepID=UPI0037A5309F
MSISGSVQDLAPQLINNRYYWLGYGREERMDDDGLTWYRSGVRHGLLNGILRVGEDRFDEALSIAKGFGELPWVWWVGPDSYRGLADDLRAAGAAEAGVLPVMAARIDQLVEPPVPVGLSIEKVVSPGRLGEWVAAYAGPMGVPADQEGAALLIETDYPDAPDHLIRFAGVVEGRVVATSALLDRGGVAGIYLVAAQEQFRRRGIGAALTWAAIAEGRRRGLRVATLQASSMGRPIYERMGFRTVAEYQLFNRV